MKHWRFAALALVVVFLWGCGISLVPSKDDWYAKHYYIMQDYEWKAYKALAPAGRLEFQKLFWTVRGPGAKTIFDRRVEYCAQKFKKENSRQPFNVDKAHVYLLNGDPIQITFQQNDAWGMQGAVGGAGTTGMGAIGINDRSNEDVGANTAEVWTYRFGQWLVNYFFRFRQPNEWKLVQSTVEEGKYRGALELDNKTGLFGIDEENAYKQKLEAMKSIKDTDKK